jgi:hypothetical protein
MSRDDDVGKVLGKWLGKARKIGEPPTPSEIRGTLERPEPGRAYGGADEALVQLNFKIPASTKKRIKQLAVRDNITLLAMLDRMLELYEREYGRLGAK